MRESSVLSGPNYLELSALQKNRRYDIWVKAETSAGYGASSDITSIILGHTGIREAVISHTVLSPGLRLRGSRGEASSEKWHVPSKTNDAGRLNGTASASAAKSICYK